MSGSTAAARTTAFAFTQCYVSFGDPDGEDFAFTKCDADGTFTLTGLPDGDWRITVFDQWNDHARGRPFDARRADRRHQRTVDMGDIAINQWQANIYTRTFFDENGNGVSRIPAKPGLALVPTNIRFRDGSFSNFNNTDLNGNADFNEMFPLFSWYVVETDLTRYKNTGTHVVYDAGGPADGTASCGTTGYPPCGTSSDRPNTWPTPRKQSRCPRTCGYRARSIAQTRTASATRFEWPGTSDPPSVAPQPHSR